MITTYYGVFETKLDKIKKQVKKILSLPKKERDKNILKVLLKEAKDLKKILKKIKHETGYNCCPKCGHKF